MECDTVQIYAKYRSYIKKWYYRLQSYLWVDDTETGTERQQQLSLLKEVFILFSGFHLSGRQLEN